MAEANILRTNIQGFDSILRDGFSLPPGNSLETVVTNGLVILLKGAPGTGKTTLALISTS